MNYTYWIDGALKTHEVLNTSGNAVTYSNYEYNPAGMLKKLENKTSANGSQRSLYDMSGSGAFDGVLNLKSMAATVSGLTSFTGTLNWNYDSRERLTSETSSARAGVMGSASYDGADNVLTRGSSGWSHNSNNQITPASGQWSYDGNGNATLQRGRSCGFDPFNRLGTITKTNEWSVGYTYRADGLMASRAKTVYVYMFGQWMAAESMPTYYFHDGGEPILEMESDMGIEGSTLTISAINVRGPDGLIARKQGGSWIYYDFDQQGSVSQRLNASGNVLSSSVYDAYGAETNNGTPTDPFGYCAQWGYWFDRDTGMYLCQARWYDPVTARWVNRDPIGYAGGANLYGYCGGGVVGRSDPWGLQAQHGKQGSGGDDEFFDPKKWPKKKLEDEMNRLRRIGDSKGFLRAKKALKLRQDRASRQTRDGKKGGKGKGKKNNGEKSMDDCGNLLRSIQEAFDATIDLSQNLVNGRRIETGGEREFGVGFGGGGTGRDIVLDGEMNGVAIAAIFLIIIIAQPEFAPVFGPVVGRTLLGGGAP